MNLNNSKIIINEISKDIFTLTSKNGYNNSTLLLDETYIYLVDTLNYDFDNEFLLNFLRKYDKKLILLVTHYHHDHINGINIINPNKIIASEKYINLINKQKNYPLDKFLNKKRPDNLDNIRLPDITFSNTISIFSKNFNELRFVNFGGHSDDSSILFIDKYKIAVCGDIFLSDRNDKFMPPFFSWGSYCEMVNILKIFKNNYSDYKIIPGHGFILDTKEKIDNDIYYLEKLKFYAKNMKIRNDSDLNDIFNKCLPSKYKNYLVNDINYLNLNKFFDEKNIDNLL